MKVKKLIKSLMTPNVVACMVALSVAILFTAGAHAAAFAGYGGIATAIGDEIEAAVPAFAGLVALVIGIPLALKVVRRIAR
jgi:hypothetical protein